MFAFLPQICAAYLLVVSLQKELKKKQKQKQSKNKTKQNKTKRNETKRNETKRNETKRNKTNKTNQKKQNKAKQNKNKTVTKTGKRFANISHLTFSNISKAYRVFRSTDCIEIINPAL